MWIRTEREDFDAVVELAVFDEVKPAEWVDAPRILTHFTFRNSGATEIDRGVASPTTTAGEGALSFAESWRYYPDATTPSAMRLGSSYAQISPRIDEALRFANSGELLEISIDSRSVRFENLSDVVNRMQQLRTSDEEGASRIVAQLFFVAMMSSWARTEGYDSSGISAYQGAGKTIPSMIVSHDASAGMLVRAELGGSIELNFDYMSYVDFPGVMIDGSTSITFGFDGSGAMVGSPEVTLSSGTSSLSATINLSGVEIVGGIPSAGTVEVAIGATSYPLDATTLLHPDLSNVVSP